ARALHAAGAGGGAAGRALLLAAGGRAGRRARRVLSRARLVLVPLLGRDHLHAARLVGLRALAGRRPRRTLGTRGRGRPAVGPLDPGPRDRPLLRAGGGGLAPARPAPAGGGGPRGGP